MVLEAEHVPEFVATSADGVEPVAHVGDAVLFEEGGGVVAEAGQEGAHFARVGGVDAEFVDHGGPPLVLGLAGRRSLAG